MPTRTFAFAAILVFLTLLPSAVFATDAPFDEEVRQELNNRLTKSVHFVYDASVAGNGDVGSHTVGTLPPKSYIKGSYWVVETQFAGRAAPAAGVKVQANVFRTADLFGGQLFLSNGQQQAGWLTGGQSTVLGFSTTSVPIAVEVLNGGGFSAGKAHLYVDYLTGY